MPEEGVRKVPCWLTGLEHLAIGFILSLVLHCVFLYLLSLFHYVIVFANEFVVNFIQCACCRAILNLVVS